MFSVFSGHNNSDPAGSSREHGLPKPEDVNAAAMAAQLLQGQLEPNLSSVSSADEMQISPGKEPRKKRKMISNAPLNQETNDGQGQFPLFELPVEKPNGRKYTTRYRSASEAPFQVYVESVDEKTPLGQNRIASLAKMFEKIIINNECWKIVNKVQIMIEFESVERANNFVNYTQFESDHKLVSFIPPPFVEVMGVIENIPLGIPDPQLLNMVIRTTTEGVNVNYIRRFVKKGENGSTTEFTTCAVYFQSDSLPRGLFLEGGMYCRVREYREKPLQCHKCSRYGHIERFCNGKLSCKYCMGEHKTAECEKAKKPEETKPKCVLCKGDHVANTASCPVYIKEREKVRRNPFPNRYNRISIHEGAMKPRNRPPPVPKPGPSSANRFWLPGYDDDTEGTVETEQTEDGDNRPRISARRLLRKRAPRINLHRQNSLSGGDAISHRKPTSVGPASKSGPSTSYANVLRRQRIKELIDKRKADLQQQGQEPDMAALRESAEFIASIACSVVQAWLEEQTKMLRDIIPQIVGDVLAQLQ